MVTAPSFAATTRSMPPTRSPPMLACSRLMVSVPSPTVAASFKARSAMALSTPAADISAGALAGAPAASSASTSTQLAASSPSAFACSAEVKRELALHHLRAALGVNGNLEDRKLGAVRRGVELALQLEGGKMRFGAGTLLAGWRQRAVVLRDVGLPFASLSTFGRKGGGDAHDDGAFEARLLLEAGHVAFKQIGGVAVRIAQSGFEPEHTVCVACARREAKLLRAAGKNVAGRDLVGSGQRRGASRAVHILKDERRSARTRHLYASAAHADLVEQNFLRREGQRLPRPADIAPIACAVLFDRDAQHRLGDRDLARFDGAAQQRADIEPGLDRARLEQGLLEASLLIGNLDVVEAKLWRRQNHQMHLAANLDVAAEKLARLGFEDWPVVVPVNKQRRREERAQHHNQHCRQGEQKRVHGSLCLRLDCEQSRGYGKAKDSSVQSAHKFDHGNAKILPGLRIFNGSSAFFMAIITSTPAPCSWAR